MAAGSPGRMAFRTADTAKGVAGTLRQESKLAHPKNKNLSRLWK